MIIRHPYIDDLYKGHKWNDIVVSSISVMNGNSRTPLLFTPGNLNGETMS